MALPTTFSTALCLLILSILAWGSWANTQKLAGKWRFELFYYDYSLGVLICAIVAAFTFGSLFSRELSFQDNLLIAGYHQMVYAAVAGVVFNLGNLLLVGAISVAGMSVAFPIAFALALAIESLTAFSQSSAAVLLSGILLLVLAASTNAFAYSGYIDTRHLTAASALRPDPRSKSRPRPSSAAPGIILSVLGGIILGLSYPLVELGRTGPAGVAPYGFAILFGAGMLLSSLLYLPFFINFPVHGQPLEFRSYLQGTKRGHLMGILGGIIWMIGTIAIFLTANVPAPIPTIQGTGYLVAHSAAIVGALWGLSAWREFKDGNFREKMLLAGSLVLFLAGTMLVTIAPLRGK